MPNVTAFIRYIRRLTAARRRDPRNVVAHTLAVRKELRWFFGFSDGRPDWHRPRLQQLAAATAALTSMEDTRSYGICFIAPAILYLAAMVIRISIGAIRCREVLGS